MPGETIVTVRGEARIEAEPEIAVLGVTIAVRDKDRARAVKLLAERTSDLNEMITGSGDGVERIESKPVRVQPIFKDAKVRAAIGFFAQGGFSVTISDFTVLGELVAALGAEDLVTLDGPWWQLRPDSPVYRDVRLAAAKDSIQRARDYAQAYGGRILSLAQVADTGLLDSEPQRGGGWYGPAQMLSARSAAADEPPEIDLIPAVQPVYAQVEARFLMTSPDLPNS